MTGTGKVATANRLSDGAVVFLSAAGWVTEIARSAVLSAELALELTASTVEVRLSAAPFVEGLLAAVVRASGGATLTEVATEAESAIAANSLCRARARQKSITRHELAPITSLTSSPVINRAMSMVCAQRSPSEPLPATSP